MKTSHFVSVFSFLGSYVWVSEWVSAKGEVRERAWSTSAVRTGLLPRPIAQDYCPGLLPRTIACLILSTYIEIFVSNLTWGPLLEFFIVVLLLVFFSGTWCNSPIPKKNEGWRLEIGRPSIDRPRSAQRMPHMKYLRAFRFVCNLWERASSLFSLCT